MKLLLLSAHAWLKWVSKIVKAYNMLAFINNYVLRNHVRKKTTWLLNNRVESIKVDKSWVDNNLYQYLDHSNSNSNKLPLNDHEAILLFPQWFLDKYHYNFSITIVDQKTGNKETIDGRSITEQQRELDIVISTRDQINYNYVGPQNIQQETQQPKTGVKPPSQGANKNSRENIYLCPYCNKTFTHKGIFTFHERTHTGEKPYECRKCRKRFAQRSDLNNHQQKNKICKEYNT